jgi:hypothetical protein
VGERMHYPSAHLHCDGCGPVWDGRASWDGSDGPVVGRLEHAGESRPQAVPLLVLPLNARPRVSAGRPSHLPSPPRIGFQVLLDNRVKPCCTPSDGDTEPVDILMGYSRQGFC